MFLRIFHNLLIKFNIALILDPFSLPFSAYFVHFRPVSPPGLSRCEITPNSLFLAYYKFRLSIFAVLLFPKIGNSPHIPVRMNLSKVGSGGGTKCHTHFRYASWRGVFYCVKISGKKNLNSLFQMLQDMKTGNEGFKNQNPYKFSINSSTSSARVAQLVASLTTSLPSARRSHSVKVVARRRRSSCSAVSTTNT